MYSTNFIITAINLPSQTKCTTSDNMKGVKQKKKQKQNHNQTTTHCTLPENTYTNKMGNEKKRSFLWPK